MQVIHQPAVADMFYPADPERLLSWMQNHVHPTADTNRRPRMLILPHAGYRFSGDTAAQGYRLLQKSQFKRVIVLCPAHRVYVKGIAVPTRWDAEATPLGRVIRTKTQCARALFARHDLAGTQPANTGQRSITACVISAAGYDHGHLYPG